MRETHGAPGKICQPKGAHRTLTAEPTTHAKAAAIRESFVIRYAETNGLSSKIDGFQPRSVWSQTEWAVLGLLELDFVISARELHDIFNTMSPEF